LVVFIHPGVLKGEAKNRMAGMVPTARMACAAMA
jgi:hypothetical protein